MDTTVVINWNELITIGLAALAPAIVGFLQQFSKIWVDKAPWWAKALITSGVGALITLITNYAAGTDAPVAAGAILASIGSINIAYRKGTRANLAAIKQVEADEAVAEGCNKG